MERRWLAFLRSGPPAPHCLPRGAAGAEALAASLPHLTQLEELKLDLRGGNALGSGARSGRERKRERERERVLTPEQTAREQSASLPSLGAGLLQGGLREGEEEEEEERERVGKLRNKRRHDRDRG